MSPRYATPAAFKQSLEHRLRTAARDDGTELGRLRQLLVYDRFLARLATAFGDEVVLKGGIVVELRLERARMTKDIDLRLLGRPDESLIRLQKAGALDLGDFLRFEVRPDARRPEIEAEGMLYQGKRFRVRLGCLRRCKPANHCRAPNTGRPGADDKTRAVDGGVNSLI